MNMGVVSKDVGQPLVQGVQQQAIFADHPSKTALCMAGGATCPLYVSP